MSVPAWAAGFEAIAVTVDGGVGWVELGRPEAANSRNQRMRSELATTWTAIASSTEVKVVVLTAAGDRFFSAGMDLKEAGAPETPGARRDRLRAGRDIEMLASLPQPTIAAVNGYALGGGLEMALACDLRIVAEHAQVGLPELAHGLVPGGGGTQRLPRLIGVARASELVFLARRLTGAEAVEWGIANRCVPGPELRDAAAALAAEVAVHDGRALRDVKRLLHRGEEVPLSVGVELELDALLTLMAERDAVAAASEATPPAS